MLIVIFMWLVGACVCQVRRWNPPGGEADIQRAGREERFKPLGRLVWHYFKDYKYLKVFAKSSMPSGSSYL